MRKKYELTDKTKTLADGTVLRRIRAVRDFTLAGGMEVREGDLGGWIEKEDNLSHCCEAWIFGNANVFGDAWVSGSAKVSGDANVYGNAWITCSAEVFGDAVVCGAAIIGGEAKIFGSAKVSGKADICGSAQVKNVNDYATYKNTWSSGRWFTYTRSNKMWRVGCFYGTGKELIAKAYRDSELSGQCYKAVVRVQETIDKAIEKAQRTK